MPEELRNFLLFVRSAFFTMALHGALLAALLSGLWWPFSSEQKIERGAVDPIQAQVFSEQEIQREIEKQQHKLEQQRQVAKNLEELKRKQAEEARKLEALERQRKEEEHKKREEEKRQQEEQKRLEIERQKKADEAKRKKREEEKRKKEEEERKRKQAEKKKKEEEERKRKEAEKKRKIAEEKKRKEAELRKKLETERAEKARARTQKKAESALGALVDRIGAAVEDNWRRPLNSSTGLVAIVRVKVSPSGEVISAKVVQSSGDQYFDQSAETAVKKASPLPFPADPKYYEYINVFNFKFNPDDN